MPSISVIIPIYNRHDCVKTALNSVYSQNWNRNDLEVILSDDNSDKPFDYLLKDYPDLKIIRADVNRGAGVARQRALDIATGEWITFLDSDDEYCAGYFDILYTIDKSYNIIRHKCKYLIEDGTEKVFPAADIGYIHGAIFKYSFLINNDIRFDDKLRIHEDKYFQQVATEFAPKDTIYNTNYIAYVLKANPLSTTYKLGLRWYTAMFQFTYSDIQYLIKCDSLLSTEHKYAYLAQSIYNSVHFFREKGKDVDPNILFAYFEYIKGYLKIDDWEKIKFILDIEEEKKGLNYIEYIEFYYNRFLSKNKYILSIIIPLYNSHKYIDKTLSNLYKQLGHHIVDTEVILTDDNSANPDYNYLLDKYRNLHILNNDTNVMMGMNRNRGLKVADGKWVCFMDHDDDGINAAAFDDFFSIPNKNKYNMIWGKCEIGHLGTDSHAILVLTHGKFFRKSFLDASAITFSDKVKTSEDLYFCVRTLCTMLEKTRGEETILFRNMTYYKWNYNPESQFNTLNNNRDYIEAYLDEHIFANILALQDDFFSEKLWKAFLLFMVQDISNVLGRYNTISSNFKKDNVKYFCGILILLESRFRVTKNTFQDFYDENIEYIDHIMLNYNSCKLSNIYFDRTFLDIAYKMIDRMNQAQIDDIAQRFAKVGIDILDEDLYPEFKLLRELDNIRNP